VSGFFKAVTPLTDDFHSKEAWRGENPTAGVTQHACYTQQHFDHDSMQHTAHYPWRQNLSTCVNAFSARRLMDV
jgi:hypothetical protein